MSKRGDGLSSDCWFEKGYLYVELAPNTIGDLALVLGSGSAKLN